MSETAAKLLEQILTLSKEERLMIAEQLELSIGPLDDPWDDPEHRDEMERRLASVANGSAESLPVDEAFVEMRAELARRRTARLKGKAS